MCEMIKTSPKLCKGCKYGCFVTGGSNGSLRAESSVGCDYILNNEGHHSRIFVNGERVIPEGYCDKYVQKKKRRNSKSAY